MAQLIKMYWRDIPAQVIAKRGRKTAKVMLASRFQEAIDRAAMRAGKVAPMAWKIGAANMKTAGTNWRHCQRGRDSIRGGVR